MATQSDPLQSLRHLAHELQCYLHKNPALTPEEELSVEDCLMMMQMDFAQWAEVPSHASGGLVRLMAELRAESRRSYGGSGGHTDPAGLGKKTITKRQAIN